VYQQSHQATYKAFKQTNPIYSTPQLWMKTIYSMTMMRWISLCMKKVRKKLPLQEEDV